MAHDWPKITLGELIENKQAFLQTGPFGTALKAAEYSQSGVPLISVREIREGFIQIGHETPKVDENTIKRLPKFVLRKGDIVFGRKGGVERNACVERNALITDTEDGWFLGSDGIFLRLTDVDDAEFISYVMRSPATKTWLLQHCEGTTMPSLNQKILSRLPVFYPPAHIKKNVSSMLKQLDDKIQLNRQTNQTLEAMAQALFKSWFVDFDPVIDNALAAGHEIPPELQARAEARKSLQACAEQRKAFLSGDRSEQESGDILPESIRQLFPNRFMLDAQMGWIPEGWEYVPFSKVAQCFDKHRVPLSKKERKEKQPGNIPYYGATSINDYINEWIFDDIFLLIGEDGSVMKEDGSPFVQYIWGKAWVNNHAHVLVLQGVNGVSTEHLMLFMQAQNITAYVTGAVQMKINQKNMNSIPFLKAGDEINKCFADLIRPFYESYRSYSKANGSLTKLRDTLLPKLISGELRLPDDQQQAKTVAA
ncbi:restriction endonuclease subunit S [Endozoicomonas sp. YOMI1]|uniref:restriction endonuclease subunit S n=1 Tax=Endozoicomonas sp. YOMI1 TaxID=2828739 RepID=UPI002148F7B7|nr:restriction endonuclease subunit S [Endozoicomonas sp. YOMI1]